MYIRKLQKAFNDLFCVQEGNSDLLRAQFEAFQKQMPLLYVILIVNTIAVAYSFRNSAPESLSFWAPLVLCSICAVRLALWILRRKIPSSDSEVLHRLQMTNKLAVVISVVFTGWSLSIYEYGDPYMKGHVAFYMALTVIACIFCLMHLRSAALITTILVLVPFCLFFFLVGVPSFQAIAVNLALVCSAMIAILFTSYRDFATLVESRKSLIAKQAETQRLSDENFRMANLDSLTDLPNRRSFFAELALCKTDTIGGKDTFAIGIMDLDGFKPANDTYGHTAGDKILVDVGRRMKRVCGANVSLARLGGDEFGLLVRGSPTNEDLVTLGRRLCEEIRLPYSLGHSKAVISSSIGFATSSGAGYSTEMLYERADYALYCAKRSARGQCVLFNAEHESQIQGLRVIEMALQNADLDAELSLAFQPIVHSMTGVPFAFEALARWNSPILGLVSPMKFIQVAERSSMIGKITRILLDKALSTAATWPDDIHLSFNLSTHDICSSESMLQIMAIINRSGVDPRRLDFEVTETAVAHDFSQALSSIVALKALGAGISLDDFGTGYSSLSHLHGLPLDKVKVDRSFVSDIATNSTSYNIVKSLSALCRDMSLKCIVEGVENTAQLEILHGLGCDYIQGYYFARPMSAADTETYIARTQAGQLKTAAKIG